VDLSYVLLPLTRGLVTAVSPEDEEFLKQWTWQAFNGDKRSISDAKKYRASTDILGNKVLLARLLFQLDKNDRRQVDHWNGWCLDNRRCNLRLCSRSENHGNQSKRKRGGEEAASRFKGVTVLLSRKKMRFSVGIRSGGVYHYLGHFCNEEEAALIYDRAARSVFGKFAQLNFPIADEVPPKPPEEIVGQTLVLTSRHHDRRKRTLGFVGVGIGKCPFYWRVQHNKKAVSRHGYSDAYQAALAREAFILENGLSNQLNFGSK
jgi:hypothetical protein